MGCAASATVACHDVAPEANPGEHQEGVDAGAPGVFPGSFSSVASPPGARSSSAGVSGASADASSKGANSSSDSIHRSRRRRRRRSSNNEQVSAEQQQRVLGWLQQCDDGTRPTATEVFSASETSSDAYGLSSSRDISGIGNYPYPDTKIESPKRRSLRKIEIDDSSPNQQPVTTPSGRKFSVEYCRAPVVPKAPTKSVVFHL